ncbi:MAG: phosphoglucosamine mutase, partial [Clostridia bacterium]|nr:phosphoglucosamine mutase [Clostridia bacterium]
YLSARFLKSKGELIGDKIVATEMSNGGLKESLSAEDISVEECAVGDSNVYRKMSDCGAVLGGEQSGHIIFGKLENTGDGLVTALMIMEAMNGRGVPLSELLNGFQRLPQLSVNVRVKDKAAVIKHPRVIAQAERVQAALKGHGRLILRKSGTEEVVRITVEGRSAEECERLCGELENAVRECGEE